MLGLSRTASAVEVERAYRRLARRYHPGVNPGDRVAEQMYAQILEAFSILGDDKRRREYDNGRRKRDEAARTTVAFEGFDFSTPAEGPLAATFSELFADVFRSAAREATTPSAGEDITLSVTIPFEDAMRGGSIPLSVTRRERCPLCAGHGQIARPAAVCGVCGGDGTRRWARGHMVFTKACDVCGGSGQMTAESCRGCQGVGVLARTEVVTVHLPAGIESGTRVAVPGRGHAGAYGAPGGDLYVQVDVTAHPFFRREGRDLHVTLPVAVHEAALGAVVSVPTLRDPVSLSLPAGVSSGQAVRVAGHGVPANGTDPAGDLIVTLRLVLPPSLDDRSRELLHEFGRRNAGDVRQHLFSSV